MAYTREERREYDRKYYQKNKDKRRKQQRDAQRKRYQNDPQVREQRKQSSREQYKKNPVKAILYQAKLRAKQKGIEFDLSTNDIDVPDVCPVLGIKLERGAGHASPNSPSLDRVDNNKGYTKDNIRVISMRANKLKNDATPEELRLLAEFYAPQEALV